MSPDKSCPICSCEQRYRFSPGDADVPPRWRCQSCGYIWSATIPAPPIAESYPGERREREERRESPPAVAPAKQTEIAPAWQAAEPSCTLLGHVPNVGGYDREVWVTDDPATQWYRARRNSVHAGRPNFIRSGHQNTNFEAADALAISENTGPIFVKPEDAWALENVPGFRSGEPPAAAEVEACSGCGRHPCNQGYLACNYNPLDAGEPRARMADRAQTQMAAIIQDTKPEEPPYPDDVAEAGIPLRPKVSP